MEIIIFLVIVAVGLFWYYNSKSNTAPVANEADSAPYKLDTPPSVAEVAASAEPVAEQPKQAKKAAAPKAKKPAAMKAKEKAPAKKPRAKKDAA